MKRIFRHLLFPPLSILALLSVVFAAGLAAVFCCHWETSALAYVLYIGSAWAATAWGAWGVRALKRGLAAIAERFPGYARYRSDMHFRAEISIYTTFALNAAFSVYKAYLGIAYRSLWFGSVASYYIVLSVMRFLLMRQILKREDDAGANMRRYRSCGYCLLILTLELSVMAYIMIRYNTGSTYPGHLIYATAGYTFYNFYLAVHNIFRYRKLNNPVISASKCISLACALVSVFTLQAAMLMRFGNGTSFQYAMNVGTAAVVFSAVLALSLFMIIKSTRALNGREKVK